MARFRKKRSRASRGGFKKSRSRGRSASGASVLTMMAGAGIYGALREKASNALQPLTSKIPLGNIADEAVLLGLCYFGQSKINHPLAKSVLRGGMVIESARIGEAIARGELNLGGGTTATSGGSNAF